MKLINKPHLLIGIVLALGFTALLVGAEKDEQNEYLAKRTDLLGSESILKSTGKRVRLIRKGRRRVPIKTPEIIKNPSSIQDIEEVQEEEIDIEEELDREQAEQKKYEDNILKAIEEILEIDVPENKDFEEEETDLAQDLSSARYPREQGDYYSAYKYPPNDRPYAFNYTVLDDKTGITHSREEAGDGTGVVLGKYEVIEPGCLIRRVKYRASDAGGFEVLEMIKLACSDPSAYGKGGSSSYHFFFPPGSGQVPPLEPVGLSHGQDIAGNRYPGGYAPSGYPSPSVSPYATSGRPSSYKKPIPAAKYVTPSVVNVTPSYHRPTTTAYPSSTTRASYIAPSTTASSIYGGPVKASTPTFNRYSTQKYKGYYPSTTPRYPKFPSSTITSINPSYHSPSTPKYRVPSTPNYRRPFTPKYSGPSTPSYRVPIVSSTSSYGAPSAPSHSGSVASSYNGPSTPSYEAPSGSSYGGPSTPSSSSYGSPSSPSYEGPSTPSYVSTTSSYKSPSTPTYEAPSSSSYGAPLAPAFDSASSASFDSSSNGAFSSSSSSSSSYSSSSSSSSSFGSSSSSSYGAPLGPAYGPPSAPTSSKYKATISSSSNFRPAHISSTPKYPLSYSSSTPRPTAGYSSTTLKPSYSPSTPKPTFGSPALKYTPKYSSSTPKYGYSSTTPKYIPSSTPKPTAYSPSTPMYYSTSTPQSGFKYSTPKYGLVYPSSTPSYGYSTPKPILTSTIRPSYSSTPSTVYRRPTTPKAIFGSDHYLAPFGSSRPTYSSSSFPYEHEISSQDAQLLKRNMLMNIILRPGGGDKSRALPKPRVDVKAEGPNVIVIRMTFPESENIHGLRAYTPTSKAELEEFEALSDIIPSYSRVENIVAYNSDDTTLQIKVEDDGGYVRGKREETSKKVDENDQEAQSSEDQ